MTGETILQVIILVLAAFFLYKSTMRLPKKIAITFLIFFGVIIIATIVIWYYYPLLLIYLT